MKSITNRTKQIELGLRPTALSHSHLMSDSILRPVGLQAINHLPARAKLV